LKINIVRRKKNALSNYINQNFENNYSKLIYITFIEKLEIFKIIITKKKLSLSFSIKIDIGNYF